MYILTGGAGFIGSAFLAELNEKGISQIIVVDELGDSEKWKNLSNKQFFDFYHKEQFHKLIAENKLLAGIKGIIHLGACSSTTERNADYMMQNNYRFSRDLAQWALERNIRFIYASSAATYGAGEQGFSDDDSITPKLRPLNVYALSKQAFDLWALQSGAVRHMAGIKFFNVYGPNEYHKQDMTSVVFKAYHQIKESGKVRLFKSYNKAYQHGEQQRDFIYVKDCSKVMWWLLEQPGVCGIFNLGTGKARTWKDLVSAVFIAMKSEVLIDYIDMPETLRSKYQYLTEAKMEKLRAAGYESEFVSLEDGIRDYVVNYLSQEFPYL